MAITLRVPLRLKKISLVTASVIAMAGLAGNANAGRDDTFSGLAIIDNLDDVYPTSAILNYGINRSGYHINSNVASFEFNSSFGHNSPGSLSPNSPAGIAEIVFDTPWQKAGVSVFNVGVTQLVFFDGLNNYLGDVTWVAGPSWATIGWDGGSAGIGRIQIVEGEYGHRIFFDDVWRENQIAAVPEPESYAMMLAGLGLLGFVARRRKQKSAA